MKILIYIDQRAAIRAGIDAPTSTVRVDLNPELVTDPDILKMVADHLDFKTGDIAVPEVDKTALTFVQSPLHEELLVGLRRMMWQWAASKNAPPGLRQRYERALADTTDVLKNHRTRFQREYASVWRLPSGAVKESITTSPPSSDDPGVTVEFDTTRPAWPGDALDEIVASAESREWIDRLEDANGEATRRAFAEAEDKLRGLEAAVSTAFEEEEAKLEREHQKRQALRQRLADWVNMFGRDLTKERLRRGWLTTEALAEIVLRQRFRTFTYQPVEFVWSPQPFEAEVGSNSEMKSILELEHALTEAGMVNVKATLPRVTRNQGSLFRERVLYATFDWSKFEFEGLAATFRLAPMSRSTAWKAKFLGELERYCENEGVSIEDVAPRVGVPAEDLRELQDVEYSESQDTVIRALINGIRPLTDPDWGKVIVPYPYIPKPKPAPSAIP